jgi:hypothetical protein
MQSIRSVLEMGFMDVVIAGDVTVDTPLALEVDDALRIPVTHHTIADAASLKDAWFRVFHAVEKVCGAGGK